MTARIGNQFIDPTGIQPPYTWAINHDTMDPGGRRRTTAQTAVTSGIGIVRQQGSETPLGMTLKGTILTEIQRLQFVGWWTLCRTQTIYFYEFSGEQYEVIITDYNDVKVRVAYNKNDATIPYHVYTYTLVMDIIQTLSPTAWVQAELGAGLNTITVTNPGSQSSVHGVPLTLQLHATDSGNAPFNFFISSLPAGLTMTTGGLISGTPTVVGATVVVVNVIDNVGTVGTTQFVWTIT